MQDSVFVITLLKDDASLSVTSGNNTQTFDAKAGTNAFTVLMDLGKQSFSVSRNGAAIDGLSGDSLKDITDVCSCGIYNFNAYVGTLPAGESDPLGPDGLASLTVGLHVSTCSATPSLGSTATATATAGARRGVADTPCSRCCSNGHCYLMTTVARLG